MRSRIVVITVVAVAAATLLAPAPAGAGRADPPWRADARSVTADLPVGSVDRLVHRPGVDMHPCQVDPAWLCGRVPVPLDRADPSQGTLRIGFMYLPHSDPGPARNDVLLATAGGPGGASSADNFRFVVSFILQPLLAHRDLLLVDRRGTGRSGLIDCTGVMADVDSRQEFIRSYGACGRQLGDAADRYGSGDVALDLEAVRQALDIPRFSYWAASYGTVEQQAYATRFPERVRAVVADSPIPVRGNPQPWMYAYGSGPVADHAAAVHCRRAPACAQEQPRAERALDYLAARVRQRPVVGYAHDLTGVRRHVRVSERVLAWLVTADEDAPAELAAVADALRHGDAKPLLRLGAQNPLTWLPGDDPNRVFSNGANAAAFCNDMNPAWDRTDPRPVRREKYAESLEGLPQQQYAPFAPRALTSIYPPDLCIGYPAPDRFVPAVRPGATSDVPALLLSGELDPTTPASLAGGVRRVLTAADRVRIAGAGHTTVFAGPCSVQITVRFLRTLETGDTSCADTPNFPFRASSDFPLLARGARPAAALPANHAPRLDRRVATVAARTVQDAWLLSLQTPDAVGEAHGLRGGTFSYDYTASDHAVVRLDRVRLARDVVVSGRSTLVYASDELTWRVRVRGPHGRDGRITGEGIWASHRPPHLLRLRGALGHGRVAVTLLAN